MKEQARKEVLAEEVTVGSNLPIVGVTNTEKLQGDARDYLNAKIDRQSAVEIAAKDTSNGQQQVLKMQPNEVQNGMANAGHDHEGVMSTDAGVIDNTAAPHDTYAVVSIEDVLKLDKGPPKRSRDVPASTIFARMYLATAGAMQAAADLAKYSMVPGDRNSVGQDKIGVGEVDSATATDTKGKENKTSPNALQDAAYHASVSAQHVNSTIDRAAGDLITVGKDKLDVGAVSSGGKVGIEAKHNQVPAGGEQLTIAKQTSDRDAAAQNLGVINDVYKGILMEAGIGDTVEDAKGVNTSKKKEVWTAEILFIWFISCFFVSLKFGLVYKNFASVSSKQ
ncbi:uncharacterized protein LOC142168704 [Nicotiana tabacum]|uniref:Uncharacterized protein LOC142168704 n=12 Tax=Nicotiana tabacum TaxID=4097 RepID=A0AC58SKL0_TOBAC